MLRPERLRRGDLAVAAALVVLALVGSQVLWKVSGAAGTSTVTATSGATRPATPEAVPATVSQVWRAPSGSTPVPLVIGPSVVTGDGSEVAGRDPLTGEIRWRYARDLQLCTVGTGWGRAVAVFSMGEFCSEVVTLDGATGVRGAQRNADLGRGAGLLDNGTSVVGVTADYLEVWRSDLVKTTEYGAAYAPEQPEKQPRAGCRYSSFAFIANRLGVVENCPGEPTERLTVLRPDSSQADKPDEEFSTLLPGSGARLVAMNGDRVAVALPGPPRIALIDGAGAVVETHGLPGPDLPPTGSADGRASMHVEANRIYWWTGTQTVAMDRNELRPLWTLPNTLGAGTTFAGRLLVPVPGGLLVVDTETGASLRTIPVDRQAHTGPVSMASIGPVLLERRGSELVALR